MGICLLGRGPTGPLGFYSCGFKDAEKKYATWEKGLFGVSLALIEEEKIGQQPIVKRGPFKVIKTVTNGTPLPRLAGWPKGPHLENGTLRWNTTVIVSQQQKVLLKI